MARPGYRATHRTELNDADHWLRALRRAVDRLGAEAGTVHLWRGEHLKLVAQIGMPEALLPTIDQIPSGKGMAGLAYSRDAAVESCNLEKDDSGDVRPGARQLGARAAMAVPMRSPGAEVVGVLGIASSSAEAFTDQDRAELLELAREMAEGLG